MPADQDVSRRRPSDGLEAGIWEVAQEQLIEALRDLIRIPSINPPARDAPDCELVAARWIATRLEDAGLRPEVIEPAPGRGSVHVRLRSDRTGGEPLLLLSHLDVVPAPAQHWSHSPFAADIEDGYVYGRGAVDMKAMIAMELGVVTLLAGEAARRGFNPARDPIPGLRRDVLFTCTADEEEGGAFGAAWMAAHRPEWLQAAGALNECGAVSITVAGRRLYPIQVAEKGSANYRIIVRGTWGHASMPREDNAAVLAATVIQRLAAPGPVHITPLLRRSLDMAAAGLPAKAGVHLRGLLGKNPARAEAALAEICDPTYARALRALVRNTLSPSVIHSGIKASVIPGDAMIEVNCRMLPGTTESDMRAELEERLGDLAGLCEVSLFRTGPAIEAPAKGPLYDALVQAIRAHDPEAIPFPVMVPFSTDARHTASLDVPTYGFSPLKLDAGEPFLDHLHGIDERVSVSALQWGFPVLYDAVRTFCG